MQPGQVALRGAIDLAESTPCQDLAIRLEKYRINQVVDPGPVKAESMLPSALSKAIRK